MFRDLLLPLVPYMADPLLTSLALDKSMNYVFLGLSLPSPDGLGRLVCRTRPFFYNNLTRFVKLSRYTEVGMCSYCGGVYLLPSTFITLCYYVPNNLRIITNNILTSWCRSEMSVCGIHFLHKSKCPSNGVLSESEILELH